MTIHLTGVYLRRPTWITPPDALLARYRAQLPVLFLEKHRYRRRLTFALALLSPFALFFGNVPLHVLLIPLSFAPILWCASLAGQDAGPLTRVQIAARVRTVSQRLNGLFGMLLGGQVASLLAVALFVLMFDPQHGAWVMSASEVRAAILTPVDQTTPFLAGLGISLLALLMVGLEFGLTVGLGTLAATLTPRRKLAAALGFGLRGAWFMALLALGALLIRALSGVSMHPLLIGFGAAFGGPAAWPLLDVFTHPEAALLTAAGLVLLDGLALGVTTSLLRRRAVRPTA